MVVRDPSSAGPVFDLGTINRMIAVNDADWAAESAAQLRALLSLPHPERLDVIETDGDDFTPEDRERARWLLRWPDKSPVLQPDRYPRLDTQYYKQQIAAIQNDAARDARRFMLAQRDVSVVLDFPFRASSATQSRAIDAAKLRFSESAPYVEAVARGLAGPLPAFPRPLKDGDASEHDVAFLRCYPLETAIEMVLGDKLLERLSQERTLAVLEKLAPPPFKGSRAVTRTRAEKLRGLKDEAARKREIRPGSTRELQSEVFLRFVPWSDNSIWKEEEERVHWILVKASSGPALDFLCTWLKNSPWLHFSRSAAWREKVELRLAAESLPEGKSAAEVAAYEIAWEILGLTSPEGRFHALSPEEREQTAPARGSVSGKIVDRVATGREWWMGGEGPAPLGSFRDAVFAWHFQDPDWWPAICKVMKAAQGSHRGWLKRRLETKRLRVRMEAPPSRQDPHPGLEASPKEGFSSAPAPEHREGTMEAEPGKPARKGLRGWFRS